MAEWDKKIEAKKRKDRFVNGVGGGTTLRRAEVEPAFSEGNCGEAEGPFNSHAGGAIFQRGRMTGGRIGSESDSGGMVGV